MKAGRVGIILAVAIIIGGLFQFADIRDYKQRIDTTAQLACDLVSARAQAGFTRDVHDQVFSFLRKSALDPNAEVIVRKGVKEVGAFASDSSRRATIAKVCHIENAPDYEIAFRFEGRPFISMALAERTSVSFLSLMFLVFLATAIARKVREFWLGHILDEVRVSLGLRQDEHRHRGFISRCMTKIFLTSIQTLRPSIAKLQQSLEEKQFELSQTKDILRNLEEQKLRTDQFAALVKQVHHDLKGPLSTLKFAAKEAEESQNSSGYLRLTIGSIEKIVSDLDVKKFVQLSPQDGVLGIEIAEVAIQESINEKQGALREHDGVTIQFEYDRLLLSPILCKSDHLRRVIANLLQNAIEASPRNGKISVRAYRDHSDHLLIEVTDQGSGVSPAILPMLFERKATHGKKDGEGLGLWFVKACVDAWSGEVSVTSAPNSGATFRISLPVSKIQAKFQSVTDEGIGNCLAVLDDEVELQRLVWSLPDGKQKFFHSPHDLMNWVEASDDADSFTYVVDLNLGCDISGIDVIRTLGSNRKSYLATSDYLNIEALELSQALGVAILPKPLLFANLS